MNKIKVTITIAVYNVEKYIAKSLLSVLDQDFEDLEILVVDDCSTDNSMTVVKSIASEHKNGSKVRIVSHPVNQGTGATRNSGIDEASGEYLLFLDGDDYISPNAITLLYNEMQRTHTDIVMGQHAIVGGGDYIESKFKVGVIRDKYAIAAWMRAMHTDYYPVALWNKLFKTEFLRKNRFEIVPWHRQEDVYFSLQTAFAVKSISTIPEVTMYWVTRPQSAVHSEVTNFHYHQYIDIFDRSIAYIRNHHTKCKDVIPYELYYILTNRYLTGFMTKNIMQSSKITKKEKQEYLNHIRTITNIGIRSSQLIGIKNKIAFMILKLKIRYLVYDLALKVYTKF